MALTNKPQTANLAQRSVSLRVQPIAELARACARCGSNNKIINNDLTVDFSDFGPVCEVSLVRVAYV